ncbi:MAG TPA: addiction module protein [Rhizomicrobium sp.]|jgi:putative addiction module component (TIGR02574 family)
MGDLSELFAMSAAERIQLAEDLWDSVAADPEMMPSLTHAQQAELERRMEEQRRNPGAAIGWEEVRRRLWSRTE